MTVKATGRAMSMPGGIILASFAALMWSVAGAALTAWLILEEVIAESALGYAALAILIIGGFFASSLAYGKIKHQRAVVSLLAGGGYYLLLLATNALFFGGQYSGAGVTLLAVLAGSGCALLMGLKKPATGKRYKIRTA